MYKIRVSICKCCGEMLKFGVGKSTNLNTLQMINICAIVRNALCRTGDRGCKCRKTAGEESPGFTGQDAG